MWTVNWLRWSALSVASAAIGLVIATAAMFRLDPYPIRAAGAVSMPAPAPSQAAEPQPEGPSNDVGDFQQLG